MAALIYGELKKIFLKRSTVVVVVLILLLTALGIINLNYKYIFSFGNNYQEICRKYGGQLTEEKENELRNFADTRKDSMDYGVLLRGYILQQLERIEDREKYVNYYREQGKELEQYGLDINDKQIINKGKFIQTLYKDEGKPIFTNDLEYECILWLGVLYLLVLLGVIFLVGNSFSLESTYNMSEILNATRNGRTKLRCAKILAAFCSVLILNIIFFGSLILMLKGFGYGLQNLYAPLYLLRNFEKAASSMTIGRFFMYAIIAQIVLSLVWATFMMFFSKITNSYITSMVLGMLCIFGGSYFEIGYYLRYIGLSPDIRGLEGYSLQEMAFMKYEKAFNPLSYLNPAYYFEKVRYGEMGGNLVKIYYFPMIVSIGIIIILGSYLILSGNNICNRRRKRR